MHSSIRHYLEIWAHKPDLVWKIYNVLTSIQSQNVSKSRAGTIQNVNEQQFLNQWRKYFSFRFTSCFQFMPVSVTKGTELSRSRIDTLKITFQKWHQIYSQTTTCLGKNLPENGWEYFPSRGLLVDQWAVLQRLLSYLCPIEPYQSAFHSPFSVSFGYFRLFDGYLEIYALSIITKKLFTLVKLKVRWNYFISNISLQMWFRCQATIVLTSPLFEKKLEIIQTAFSQFRPNLRNS